jgi:exodeoxyribonuclease X
MLCAVVDTETSGLTETDQVCELAIAMISECGNVVNQPWRTFIKPSCPMSIGARATHHITDVELSGAPTMTELLLKRGLPEFGHPSDAQFTRQFTEAQAHATMHADEVVFVAHNAVFDRQMLIQSGVHPDLLPKQTICTYKCAKHIYPDAEQHTNQYLRYYLGLEPAFATDGPPHRALPDVAVTSSILLKMLDTHTPDQLINLTQQPVLLKTVRFGQSYGKLWQDMDVGFLRWMLAPGRNFGEDELFTARHWLQQKSKPRIVST